MGDERTDLERVGQFVDGPYDTDVTLYRPDIVSLMGRDGPQKDDPLRLDGPFPIIPGHKLKAATNDWTFSPFLYLWEEEPYQDPGAWRKEYKKERDANMIAESPFISTVGEKSMNGLGTYYGTFITEMESFSPELREDKDDRLKGVPNFLTNPGKKGSGYGYVDITINPYPEYMEDPAFDSLEAHRQMREEFESRMVGEKWIPSGAGQEFFDPNPFRDDRDPDGTIPTYDWDRLIKPAEPDDRPIFLYANHTKMINGNKDVIPPLERVPPYDPSSPYETVPFNVFRKFDPVLIESLKELYQNSKGQVGHTLTLVLKVFLKCQNFLTSHKDRACDFQSMVSILKFWHLSISVKIDAEKGVFYAETLQYPVLFWYLTCI